MPTAEATEDSTIQGDDLGIFAGLDMGPEGADFDPSADEPVPPTDEPKKPVDEPSSQESGDVTSDNTSETTQKTPAAHDEPKETNWEKRFKDTQKSFQEERQARKDLEAKVDELSKLKQDGQTTAKQDNEVKDIISNFKEQFEEDPETAIANAFQQLNQKVDQVNANATNTKDQVLNASAAEMARQEELARKEFSDYDDVVNDSFLDELQKSPALVAQWQQMGGKPEHAYKLAKQEAEIKVYRETGKWPDAPPEKKEEAPPKKSPQTLDDISSAPPKAKTKADDFNSLSDVNRMLGLTL